MKRPNPLHPHHMTPAERRAELCRILALGLIRLRMGAVAQVSAETGEFLLHNSPRQSGHATTQNGEHA
ncbi:hypothetical protein LCL97_11485 [Seohaeicola saemankumensis]|nr:hypothetical protein [Seohaeicola saemankumensis]MCA0871451.1 hypothetical protein [Seohaeicola saemankumensis]